MRNVFVLFASLTLATAALACDGGNHHSEAAAATPALSGAASSQWETATARRAELEKALRNPYTSRKEKKRLKGELAEVKKELSALRATVAQK
jgi:hypothetical protein